MKQVELFTDGACLGNPGPGGWAALLRYGSHERMLSGGEPCTTNNRMELTALLQGLRALKEPCEVHLFSDSQYLVKALNEWLPAWEKRGMRRADGKPIENRDLWEALMPELKRHRVVPHWIRGHNGHPENERVDREARRQAQRQKALSQTPCPPEGATVFPR
ncbi:ribonuclease HI [Thermus antranikianii]|uniref:ribonuclease HI n=1 Tax=Thermus antranikianii TaxID=88190 RepID=UPI001C783057|nr:ribonuclease HI [Thermus antranikianii]QWK22133.1 MAG: ribonuclease HI [Thermus antranikianii]